MGLIGDIAGAVIGSKASKKASKAQVEATKLGIAEIRRQYDLSREDLAPWRQAGGQAIGAGLAMLQPGYDHTTSPGYQFRFGEGQRAVESGAAARGMLMSGGTLKDLTRFGQGVASGDFNDQFNRYMAIAGGGQQAATSGAQMGQQSASGIADLYTQAGNARASGYIGSANAWVNGINNFDSRLQQAAMMASDRRLKTNIERVGDWDERGDGLGKYRFAYKWAPSEILEGVMADEVEQLRPAAFIPRFRGEYAGVNYAMLEDA